MAELPRTGACLCGEVAYRVEEDPLAVYACHCTDCQRQTGSSFSLTMLVRRDVLRLVRGEVTERRIHTDDGRVKQAHGCARCGTRLFGPAASEDLLGLEPGTLDDASWVEPAAHIWTRSRQRWLALPEGALRYERQPRPQEWIEIVRAWQERRAG